MKKKIQKKGVGTNKPVVFVCYPIVHGCSTAQICAGKKEDCRAAARAYEQQKPGAWCIIIEEEK